MSFPYAHVLVPDYRAAIIDHLRSLPIMTAVVAAANITGRVIDYDAAQNVNHLALVYAGGRDSNFNVPIMFPHLNAHCMGTNGYESMRIWRTLKSLLEHPSYRMQGFVAQGCSVMDVRVGLPMELPDLGVTVWDKRVAPIYMTVNEVPVG